MSQTIVSAVFDDRAEAKRAFEELRNAGISESAISIVGRPDEDSHRDRDTDNGHSKGDIAGAAAKGGVAGALLGVAALAIPGVGPLAAAGAIAASAAPTAGAIGAAVGAADAAIAKLLKNHFGDDRDAGYYEDHIMRGGVFVSVDTRQAEGQADIARNILQRFGGNNALRPKTEAI